MKQTLFFILILCVFFSYPKNIIHGQESADIREKEKLTTLLEEIKNDFKNLAEGHGGEFAPSELAICEKHMAAASNALEKNDFAAASGEIQSARNALTLAIEKTRYGLIDERQNVPRYNASFGIGLTFGSFKTFLEDGVFKSDHGYAYGASFVFEKMFSNRFGIHSGLGYLETEFTITEAAFSDAEEIQWHIRALNMPLLLITSLNTQKFSLNLLTGVSFYHLLSSELKTDEDIFQKKSRDVLQPTTSYPVMAAAGFNLKFRVGDFTDIYAGAINEISIQKIVPKNRSTDVSRFISTRLIAGFLLRTDIFPMN